MCARMPPADERIPRGGHQIVAQFYDFSIFVMIEPEFLELVILLGEHLEPAIAHPVEHLDQSAPDRGLALVIRCVLEPHIEALLPELLRQRDAGAGHRLLMPVMRPGPAQMRPPRTDHCREFDRRLFLRSEGADYIERAGVPIEDTFHSGGRMVPAEVEASDPRPVIWNSEGFNDYRCFGNGEDAAGTKDRNSLRAGLKLVRWVRSHNLCPFLGVNMLGFFEDHRNDVAVFTLLMQKSPHHL